MHDAEISIAPVPAGVAVGLAATLTTAIGMYDSGPARSHTAATVAMGLVSLTMLFFSLGLRYRSERRALLMRTVASVCTIVALPTVLLLAFFDASPMLLTLCVSVVMLITTLAAYTVYHGAENAPTTRAEGNANA